MEVEVEEARRDGVEGVVLTGSTAPATSIVSCAGWATKFIEVPSPVCGEAT